MERFIAGLVKDFESGKIGRRQFCEAVALAATVYGFGGAAKAAPAQGLKMLGVNHISYACDDYTKARDFYSETLQMQVLNDNHKSRANLAFGPEPGKGGSFLVARNFGNNPPKRGASIVDHIAYTIPDWDDAKVENGLKAAGANPAGGKGNFNVYDPNGFQVQITSIQRENPFN
jgi:catechol 2,3-dioxygenase-like lactoylglutathione lyase family enzyme